MEEFCALILDKNNQPVFESESQYEYPHKFDKDVITYCVMEGTEDSDVRSRLNKMVGIALTTWGIEIPTKFHRVRYTENPDIKIRFENDSIVDPFLKKNTRALAYAYYPKTSRQGIVVFNDYSYEWGTKDEYRYGRHVYNAIHVLIHEFGHTLGLSHDSTNPGKDVMDPVYGKIIKLSDFDIARIRYKYGVRVFSRWNLYTRLKRAINHRAVNIT